MAYNDALTIEHVDTINMGGGAGDGISLGGATNFDYVDTENGYYVDGTQIIDGDGNFDGAITGTSGTFSGTLAVTGATTLTGALTADVTDVGRFTQGGAWTASTTAAATAVLPVSDLITYSGMNYTPTDAAVTLTLPATSTMTAFIPNAGDEATWHFTNETATAATSTTIAAGTGIDLRESADTGADVVIEGGNHAKLTFKRSTGGNVICTVEETIVAD